MGEVTGDRDEFTGWSHRLLQTDTPRIGKARGLPVRPLRGGRLIPLPADFFYGAIYPKRSHPSTVLHRCRSTHELDEATCLGLGCRA